MKALLYGTLIVTVLHGLIHLMGLVAYWPLGTVAELPYKTTVLGGQWDLGRTGMRLFGVLWLIAAVGFLLAAAGLLFHQGWWRPVMLATIGLSTLLIALDWAPAFRGTIANLLLLAVLALVTWLPGLSELR